MRNEFINYDIYAIRIELLRPFPAETLRLMVRKQLGGVQ